MFKIDPEDLRSLLREAEITSRRLNGEKLEDIEEQLEEDSFEDAEEADEEDVKNLQAEVEMESVEETQEAKSWWKK